MSSPAKIKEKTYAVTDKMQNLVDPKTGAEKIVSNNMFYLYLHYYLQLLCLHETKLK